MKIVIDISEDCYKQIRGEATPRIHSIVDILDAVTNGKPLPKGHGRLIDADAINWFEGEDEEENPCYILDKRDLNLEPTIIEADKEAQDEDSD